MNKIAFLNKKSPLFLILALFLSHSSAQTVEQILEKPLERTVSLGLVHRYDQQTWLELGSSLSIFPLLQLRDSAHISLEGTVGLQLSSLLDDPVQALIPKEWSFGIGMRGLGPPSSSLSYYASSFVGLGLWGSPGVDLGLYIQGGVLLPVDRYNDLSLSVRLLEDGIRQRADVQLGWQFNY
jgi:hypothetical protein